MKKIIILSLVFTIILGVIVYAHPGRLDSIGGHNNNAEGNYHYHTGKYAGWIVNKKGDVPNSKKDKYNPSLISGNISSPPQSIKPTLTPSLSVKPITSLSIKPTPLPSITPKPSISPKIKVFTDVDNTHWSYEAIKVLKEKGIITGYSDGSFQPNKPITRAEIAYIIYKISK